MGDSERMLPAEAKAPAVEAGQGKGDQGDRITAYLVFACVLSCCGSFIMGYDAYVLGGVSAFPDFLALFFPAVLERQAAGISKYCYFNDPNVQWLSASAFLAGMAAAMPAVLFINRFGRKRVMLACGISFLAALSIKVAAQNRAMLLVGRAMVGATAACSNTAIQMYVVELAPPRQRARLGETFQAGIVMGALLAPLVNAGTKYLHPWGWRLSFAIPLVPALLLMLAGIVLPDTPNSELARGRPAEARAVLERVRGTRHVDAEWESMLNAAQHARRLTLARSFTTILRRPYRPYAYLSISATTFQIWTGINFLEFFGVQLLVALGLDYDLVYWLTFAGTPIGLLGVFASMAFTDRLGRRRTLLWTTAGMCACMLFVGLLLAFAGTERKWVGWVCLVILWIFGLQFNAGWGAVATMYPTEINPLETRAAGQALATFSQNLWNFVVARTSLSQLCAMRWGVFLFFAGLLLLWAAAVAAFCVEPLAELERVPEAFRNHWFWRRWHERSADAEPGEAAEPIAQREPDG